MSNLSAPVRRGSLYSSSLGGRTDHHQHPDHPPLPHIFDFGIPDTHGPVLPDDFWRTADFEALTAPVDASYIFPANAGTEPQPYTTFDLPSYAAPDNLTSLMTVPSLVSPPPKCTA